MWRIVLSLGFLAFLFSSKVESAKILCASHQFGSHMNMVHTSVEGLIARGHEVYTIFSDRMPVPKKLEGQGFKILRYHTPKTSGIMSDPHHEAETLQAVFEGRANDHRNESLVAYHECVDMDNDKELEKQLRELQFDIIVLDAFPLTHCLMFLSLKLRVPFVYLTSLLEQETNRIPLLPSFYPVPIFLYSDNMSFMERLMNTVSTVLITVPSISPFVAVRNIELLEKYNDDPSVTTWHSLARKAQLHFLAKAGMLEYPIPLPPNVINIECLTCHPGKPLEGDIQQMADSSEGIIVVSFGSLITKFPDETAEKFLTAFARRKELIFWRYKGVLPGKVPPNVKIMKWLPQNDLLAHPKTKLFITHSGNNGQYESVYHGVPMLAFPLFAEQPHNAHRIVLHGFGLKCDILNFETVELSEKMNRIINDPSFSSKTQHASRIMKKSPMNSREAVAFWVEHVLEFGSDHLRSHALDMPWYSFYMFDILLFFLSILTAAAAILVYISIRVYKKFVPTKKDEKKKKQ